MVDEAATTLVDAHVMASVSEESFIDNSYTNDSSDSGVRDILGIKHIHKMKTNTLSPNVLGTVIKVEYQNDNAGDWYSPEHADSVDCSFRGQRKKKSKKKKSRKSLDPDVLSDVEETDILECAASASSRKHKKKKISRNSSLTNVEEADVHDGDNLDCSALDGSHKHKRVKKSKSPKPATLSDVTGWVMEADSLDYVDPLSLGETETSRKRRKKRRKEASDSLSNMKEGDGRDHDTSVDSQKHRKRSRKSVHSDMLSDAEEASCVHSKEDMFSKSGNLSDVVNWVLASESLSDNDSMSLDPSMSSQKKKKGSKRLTQSDGLPDLQFPPDPLTYSKKKSRKSKDSDNLLDGTNLAINSDGQTYNDIQPDSEKPHKVRKKSRKSTHSDTLSSIEETNVCDHDTPVGSHKHKRTKKNRTCTESETSGVEETSRVADNATVHSEQPQEANNLETFFNSGILSDVPDLEQDADSITGDISQSMCIPDSQLSIDSLIYPISKKKSRKSRSKSDTPPSGTDLVQHSDFLVYSNSQSLNDPVTSPKSKKKSRKQTKSDTLSNGTDLVQEADILDYSNSQSLNDSLTSPKSKKKSRKQTKSDTLSNGTDLVQEADILDYSNSQSLNDSVTSHKSKKKSRKQSKSDTLSNGTDLVQEANILDYSNSQSLNDSVTSLKRKKKSRKRTNSSTFSDETEFVLAAENLDDSDSQSLISSKKKKKRTKLAQSETLSGIEESDCNDLPLSSSPSVASRHKDKSRKRSRKSPSTDDSSAGSRFPDKLKIPSPWRKNRPVEHVQSDTPEVEEDHIVHTQSQLFVSLDFQTPKQRRKSKKKLDVRKEPNEEEQEEEEEEQPQSARNKLSLSDDDIFRDYRCERPRMVRGDDSVLVEMLTDVIDDDEKFADILHAYEKNISGARCRKTQKLLQEERLFTNANKWSPQEDEQLKKNWESFQQMYPEAEAEVFLNCKTLDNKEDMNHIKEVIKETDFYLQLGVNIRRHLCQIYRRARILLIQRPNRLERGDDRQLETLQRRYGDKWAKIARLLGTSEHLVEYRLKAGKKGTKKGVWSDDEDKLLTTAVRETAGDQCLDVDHPQISWPKVAKSLPGRNTDQCYFHWFGVVQPRLKMEQEGAPLCLHKFSGKLKSMFTNRQLVDSIDSLEVDSAADISWTRVCEMVDRNLPVGLLKNRWQKLKRGVPDYKQKTFTQIMEHLRQETHE